jgi:hypothetical protein
MRRWAIAMGFLASVTTGAQDPPVKKDYPKDGVFWAASWKEAQDEAYFRNVPMHIAFHKDDSDPCLLMADSVYTEKKFIEASRMWVNVAAHKATSHAVDMTVNGKKVQVCERYWNIPCSAHSMCFDPPKRKYGVPDEFPFRIFTDPEGNTLGREPGAKTAEELIKKMERLLDQVPGPKLTVAEWLQVRTLRGDGEKAFNEKVWPKAIEAYTGLSKFAAEKAKKWGEDGLESVGKEGDQLYQEAFQLVHSVEKVKVEEGKKLLQKIAGDFQPLKAAKMAEDLLKSLAPRPK